jgi:hypothetical protein
MTMAFYGLTDTAIGSLLVAVDASGWSAVKFGVDRRACRRFDDPNRAARRVR